MHKGPSSWVCVCLFGLKRRREWSVGNKGIWNPSHASTKSSWKIFFYVGTRSFFLIISSLLSPWLLCSLKIFILVFSLEKIIMVKLFNNVALSFIWSLTQESPGALQRLIMIHKAHKMDLNLKHFESCKNSIN